MVWDNPDDQYSAAGDLQFWNPATGDYIALDEWDGSYFGVVGLTETALGPRWKIVDRLGEDEFYLASKRWPGSVYSGRNTDPTDEEGTDATVWPWMEGHYEMGPTPDQDEWIIVDSGKATCLYWDGTPGEYDDSDTSTET
jgi:hypothetical protein